MARHHLALPGRSAAAAALIVHALTAAPAWAGQDGPGSPPEPSPTARVSSADAGSGRAEIEAMREEIAALRSALDALRGEVGALRAGAPAGPALAQAPAAPPSPVEQPAAVPLEVLQTQVEELAQTKVESGSRFPVTLSGTILSNTVYNSRRRQLARESEPGRHHRPTGSMTSTLRQSRIGVDVGGIPVGGWKASGAVIIDFFGGTPGFVTGTVMGLPRLLYAFARLDRRHGRRRSARIT